MPKVDTPQSGAIERKGLALISSLQGEVEALQVKTAHDYLTADELLGRVRSGRRKWLLEMAPIIDPAKETVAAAKKTLKGAEALFDKFDAPMSAMETGIKQEMREYKLEEQRQIQAAAEERDRAAMKLRQEAAQKALLEAKAKTNPMRERLAQARQALEQQATETEEQEAPAVIKGASSTSRKVKKWRITDFQTFVTAAGNGKVVPISMVIVNDFEMNALLRHDPATLASFPGVEVYDDVVIAGR